MIEGRIKFKCRLTKAEPPLMEKIRELNKMRNRLYSLGLIGFKNKAGFGNISERIKGKKFIITGFKTGKIKNPKPKHYTEVTKYDFKKNSLECKGKVKASSESLTHAAIYESDEKIKGVIHVHNLGLWKNLIGKVPCTKKETEHGTPEMAEEIKKLFRETNAKEKKIIVMKGHQEGILCFGKNIREAGNTLLNYLNGIQTKDFTKSLSDFLKEKKLKLEKKIAKGFSSEIFLVKKGKKNFALKIEKVKSRRNEMAEKEVENLRKANSVSVGPELYAFDLKKRIILMEFIKGKTFSKWVFGLKKNKINKKKLKKFIKELFLQAEKLDEIGLDHGQLAGRGVNILVKRNLPVIIDFEKASANRKCHNKAVLESFLFLNPKSSIAKKVKEILN